MDRRGAAAPIDLPEDPTMKTTEKIDDKKVRPARLKKVEGKFVPSVTYDTEVKGFGLHVTTKRAFWAITYQPRGINPATGKRWGGGVRHELGDAYQMSLSDARAAARAIKARVALGEDPHRRRMAATAAAVAERAILPKTAADALGIYLKAVEKRHGIAANTRRLQIFYARKAMAKLKAERMPLTAIDESVIRLMLEGIASPTERWHLFSAARRFLGWCRKQKLIEHNPCDDLDADDRPDKPRSRDNVPSLAVLKAVWDAVESEPAHARDLYRFLLLVPLRRSEAASLTWSDVELAGKRISIPGNRTKSGGRHELPLSPAALDLLETRKQSVGLVFGAAGGKLYTDWGGAIRRIRKKIGQAKTPKEVRYTPHDTRRAFVSELAGRFDVDLLDQCLGHTRKGVFAVYQRSARWPERMAALNAWASLITGDEGQADNVLSFPKAASI
jgi:integrase